MKPSPYLSQLTNRPLASHISANKFLSVLLLAILVAPAVSAANDNPLSRVFPYGVYIHGNNPEVLPTASDEQRAESIDRVCKDLADHHMNCVWLTNLNWKYLPMWLEAGQKHGIRVVPQGGGNGYVKPGYYKDKQDIANRAEPFYREMADKYRDDPTLLAYSVSEENNPIPWFYEALSDLTDKMAQWDPEHPMITIDYKASSAWLNATIVKPRAFCRDVYVFFADGLNGPYCQAASRSLLTRECQRLYEAAKEAGSVYWIMGQCMRIEVYGDGQERLALYRYPTPEQTRWQVWTSIQEGAKGFFYFMYLGNRGPRHGGEFIQGLRDRYGNETEQFRTVADVGRQLKPLMPLILKLDMVAPHERVVYWENSPVSGRTFVHRDTGRKFVIAVNHDCENIQPLGIEIGYWPRFLEKDRKLFDLRSRRGYDYHTFKLTTLLPGDGTIFFVGTDEDWSEFSEKFYQKRP